MNYIPCIEITEEDYPEYFYKPPLNNIQNNNMEICSDNWLWKVLENTEIDPGLWII